MEIRDGQPVLARLEAESAIVAHGAEQCRCVFPGLLVRAALGAVCPGGRKR